jgi:membrane-bound lytic murein transglycosylase D
VERFIGLEDSVARMTRDSLSRVKGSEFEVKSLPEGTRGGRGGGGRYYTVRKGDTLSKVARKHGMSVKELKRKNGLKRDEIRVGQRLKVR